MSGQGAAPPDAPEQYRFSLGHRIRYEEVDAQGIVGNATWLLLLQYARIEYLRSAGLMWKQTDASVQAVVRRASIEYSAPARFDEQIVLRVRCAQMGNRSALFLYRVESQDGRLLVTGETALVCVDMRSFTSVPWPAEWRKQVGRVEQHGV